MISRTVFPRRRGRRPLLGMAIAGLSVALLTVTGLALAVHDLNFQLDGDTTTTDQTPTSPGTPALDWDSLFNADGTSTSTINAANTTGFTHGDFVRDFRSKVARSDSCTAASALTSQGLIFCTNDTTTFATGSKDILAISGWQCNTDNNVNSKIDIMNAYAASYRAANGDRIIYFGRDKKKDNGNNNVGFWFLQGNANCDAANGTATWSGSHTDGDVLVVSEFTNGGGVSGITAYQWAGGADGCIDSDGDANRCDGLSFGQGGDCKVTSALDNICATTNSGPTEENDAITTKWLTADATLGVGHTVVPPDFFEGGINITKIFSESGSTAPSCFNTFVGDTRSSQELTATLFDYARGQLGECSATIVTTPSLTTTTLGSSDPITDLANVAGTSGTGTAPKPTGTVSFFLCGPGVTSCLTGGAAVTGNPVTLANCNPDVAGHSCATSGNVRSLVTAVGTYCFRAVYNPGTDPNYQSSAGILDGSANECFTVTGVSGLSTAQKWLPNDTATITGDATLSGNATFTLYTGSDCNAGNDDTLVYTSGNVAVSGASPQTAVSGNTTVILEAGSGPYSWLVTYDDAVLTDPAPTCEISTITIDNTP
jgi:hypothetical protein